MPVIAVIGAQWGDEGKGKIIDLLSEKADMVVRFSGGDNAGHTVINPQGDFKLHLVPSGIFYRGATCILGNGVVINPTSLIAELDDLQKHGVDTSRLFISDRAHLIMPYHLVLDRLEEQRRGQSAIGTTLKGIGPAFTDKYARQGIRAGDLLNREAFKIRLASVLELKNAIIEKVYGGQPLSLEEIFKQYCAYADRLGSRIRQTEIMVQEAVSRKQTILMEGAQGTLLDPDFGTYPYTTSSSPLSASAALGAGLAPCQINHIMGVAKSYTTRVGGGPMPTELKDKTGDLIRERAQEFGTTTGRARRCGWFDAVAVKFAVRINGMHSIALTRLDILDIFPTVKICTGYKVYDKVIDWFPSDIAVLEKCQPVYEELPGWQTPTSGIREFKKLPKQARQYVERLEKLLSCPASIISVGARREETITVRRLT
ncbi:MAG: adenylosuccinate synthase [Chloroflexota bacterium]